MKKKHIKNLGFISLIFFLGIIFIPVLIKQFTETEKRQFHGKRLNEMNYQEVKFKNEEQELSLAGMLFIPQVEGSLPAVVIIPGSGTSQRENIWYLTLAAYLQDNGILVLLPDKRGSGQSEGNWRSSNFEDLASDVIAAVTYLKSQDKLQITNIGVIGMSQGGQIAPIAANKDSDIGFIVNVVGSAVTMHEQFYFEEKNNLQEIGFLPVISSLIAKLSTYYHINIGNNKEFWKLVGNFNSIDYWEKIKVNVLVLYGENDTNTPTHESVNKLNSLNKNNIYIKIYYDSGHALEDPKHLGSSIFRKDALMDIKEFILAQ